jgi:hypothetical protein
VAAAAGVAAAGHARECATKIDGQAVPCGHYLPEGAPWETTAALLYFLNEKH